MNTSPALLGHAPDANGWMPIETVPKDGTRFLAICTNPAAASARMKGYQHVDWWRSRERGDAYEGLGHFNASYWPASHWQPLPKPPVSHSLPLVPLPVAEPSTACILPAVEDKSPAPQEARP